MSRAYARYNANENSVDVMIAGYYTLRLDCALAESRLTLTPGGQCELNALALDKPLEYAVMALEGSMQSWVDCGERIFGSSF